MRTRRGRGVLVACGVAALPVWVWFAPFSVLGTANLALSYGLIAISLVVLTGWVGQISLAQASFVGIGAFVTGVVVRGLDIPFPLTLPIAAIAAGASAAGFGVVALRVRGLYLAVATLIFAWMADEFLFSQSWLAGVGGSASAPARPLGIEGSFPYLDFTDRRTFYFILLATVAAAVIGTANLRDSKTGRAWFAVKGSETAAASLGIAVTRYKLLAFAVSGFLAGTAGNLLITHQQVTTARAFAPNVSLFYLAVAVVGGLASLPGAVASGVLFASLEELFYRVEALQGSLEIVSAVLLAAVLLFFPAGLAGVPAGAAPLTRPVRRLLRTAVSVPLTRWRRVRATADEAEAELELDSPRNRALPRLRWPLRDSARSDVDEQSPDALAAVLESTPHEESSPVAVAPLPGALAYVAGTATKVDLPPRPERPVILSAQDITVRFGGLTAVDDAHLEVRQGEVVGLIGPNGAGKTTLFNAISGLNEPTEGRVELFGHDITSLPVHERARRGMGRTFQIIQLFPQLSVFENLLVATHLRNTTGLFRHLVTSDAAIAAERTARDRGRQVISLLGLEEDADRPVTSLPFGRLRMVEIARALVTGAPFVMLDEPASGLDNAETEKLADLLLWVRQSLGVALLVIEHDVKMVTGLTDYMYVIERGRLVAEGTPADVQRNEAVIAAYLGRPAGSVTSAVTSTEPVNV